MRIQAFLLGLVCSANTFAQYVLDGPFIRERFTLNASANLLEDDGVGFSMLDANSSLTCYALEEPNFWVKRIYQRIEPSECKELSERVLSDSISPLVDIVNNAIDSNKLSPFKDMNFSLPFPSGEHPQIVISTIVLKVDFSFDYTTKKIVPNIMGLGFEPAGGEPVYFDYPELRYILEGHKVRTAQGLVDCATYFDKWLFNSHPSDHDTTHNIPSCLNCAPLLEQQAEFDALTDLFLVQRDIANHKVLHRGRRTVPLTSYAPEPLFVHVEFDKKGALLHVEVRRGKSVRMVASYNTGKPDGPFRAFYPDGSLKEEGQFKDGLREGQWTSWFSNRNIRSRRTYIGGLLDGMQRVYYENGGLFLEYGMSKGDYEGPHATYYDDGTLKASGTMTGGFVSGGWTYNLRINDSLRKYMDEHAASFSFPASAWQDGVLSYHVIYTEGPSQSDCMLHRCIQWTYSDVE